MMLPLRSILCPTDFSDASYEGLNAAVEIASHFNARLLLVHVLPKIERSGWADGLEDREAYEPGLSDYEEALQVCAQQKLSDLIKQRLPKTAEAHGIVKKGDPALEIVRIAEDDRVGLIVLSTHGMSGWRQVAFGSVAERVVRLSCTPVLTIRTPRELL
jgi:nucleotide-binding universal stress UspA family protein